MYLHRRHDASVGPAPASIEAIYCDACQSKIVKDSSDQDPVASGSATQSSMGTEQLAMAAFPSCPTCGCKHFYDGFVPQTSKAKRMLAKIGVSACRVKKQTDLLTWKRFCQSEQGRNTYIILATPPGTDAMATTTGSLFTDAFIHTIKKDGMMLMQLLPAICDELTAAHNRRQDASQGDLQLPTAGKLTTLSTETSEWRFR